MSLHTLSTKGTADEAVDDGGLTRQWLIPSVRLLGRRGHGMLSEMCYRISDYNMQRAAEESRRTVEELLCYCYICCHSRSWVFVFRRNCLLR